MGKVTFTLEGKELEEATAWRMSHTCDFSPVRIPGAPEGYEVHFGYQYTFIECGIGTAIRIRCERCGKSHDVTDYDW